MTRSHLLVAAVALLSACAASAPAASTANAVKPSDDEKTVLATMDRYMAAITAQDVKAMAAMQTPEGMTYRARAAEGGAWDVVPHPNSYWTDPAKIDPRSHRERYWSPTVLVRGGIAVVWAPYEFWIDGKTSHCGIDAFDFVKIEGRWRVANSMWSVEPKACEELRPADPSMIRPTE